MRCKLSGAIYVRRSMWGNLCGAIHLTVLKSSSPMLAQTSHPPTRNLFGKTHDAGGGGATDDGVDDGILNAEDRLRESMMQVSVIRIFGCAR